MSVSLPDTKINRGTAAAADAPGPDASTDLDRVLDFEQDVAGHLLARTADRTRSVEQHDIPWPGHAGQACGLLAAIVESSHDAIVSEDLDSVIVSWNQSAQRLFGYRPDDVIGKAMSIIIPPDRQEEHAAVLGRIRRGERVDPFETVRRRQDGSLVDVSLTISPVKDARGLVTGASNIARDISERKEAQARQELLAREVQHRARNLFAVVQAVASVSFAGKQTVKEAEAAVLSRLTSLAQTHAMLVDSEWAGAELERVVEAEMGPYAGRVRIDGPKVRLKPKAAQNFGLALHELATNAAKYGALSNATGWVDINWSIARPGGSQTLAFRWQEHGGPPVRAPKRKGFGSKVLEYVMGEYLGERPRIEFAPCGVRYAMDAQFDAIALTEQAAG